jgi:hypothetical protein
VTLAGHVGRMGEKRSAYLVLVQKPEEKSPLGRPRRRWVLQKQDGAVWTRFIWLRIGIIGGLL